VRFSVNFANRMVEVEGKDGGKPVKSMSFPLQKKVLRYYTLDSYPTSEYIYDFRHESLVSGIDLLWFEGDYPYLKQTFDLPRSVSFFALQNDEWKQLAVKSDGALRFSDVNKFVFSPVKTTAIKMVVDNKPGKHARAFSTWFTEESSAGYFLRCRRENGELHLMLNDTYLDTVKGKWEASSVGLWTENQKAVFNGMLFYQIPE
ncbi:MAG: hypothetical protein Q7J05_07015, partial [Paludibacter sp.]|nr:hypothetical protein [Paludibacter sp.]